MNAFIAEGPRLEALSSETVKVLVPKNRSLREYREETLKLIDIPGMKKLELRGEDIPLILDQLLKCGQRALGMTGEDLLKEYMLSVTSPMIKVVRKIEWNDPRAMFGKPTLCLLGPMGSSLEKLPREMSVCISSKYRLIADRYLDILERKGGFAFKKFYSRGMSEVTFSEGLSDLVVDVVYTGSSMREAGLEVYGKIMSSDFVIIGGKDD